MLKRLGTVVALMGIAAGVVVVQAPEAARAAEPASVVDAIDDGQVAATFEARGASSGAAVILRIQNTTSEHLTLTVPAGLFLRNSDPREQDLIVLRLLGERTSGGSYRPSETIELAEGEEKSYVIEGYCINAHKENPSNGRALVPDGLGDGVLVSVLDAVDRVREARDNLRAIQVAVWAITDDISAADLDDIGFPVPDRDIDVARKLIEVAGYDPTTFHLFV